MKKLEIRDVMLLGGLVLLALGFGILWTPAGLIVPGGILVAIAVFGVPR